MSKMYVVTIVAIERTAAPHGYYRGKLSAGENELQRGRCTTCRWAISSNLKVGLRDATKHCCSKQVAEQWQNGRVMNSVLN